MYNMEDIWEQAPGKFPELIIQTISKEPMIHLPENSQESFFHVARNWLFPSFKEFPLPNYPTYWKNRI